MGDKDRRKLLSESDRKKIAIDMLTSGRMIKQVAADHGIKIRYAYIIFDEFLEWRLGWKEKSK